MGLISMCPWPHHIGQHEHEGGAVVFPMSGHFRKRAGPKREAHHVAERGEGHDGGEGAAGREGRVNISLAVCF